MKARPHPQIDTTVLDAAALLALALGAGDAARPRASGGVGAGGADAATPVPAHEVTPAELVGVWTNADRTLHLELRPDGRYGCRLVGRHRPGSGTYRLDPPALLLSDRSGLGTTVHLIVGGLQMAGHRLYRG